ncbi:hypothetical protein XELAEV_18041915mg [Xenopus laevis]|uniref:GIY-YIG domain-containing protein n=1 Tax=Xenopus laevis TaxID=8355 RepID=A0A974C350_XENLA|nr:hypothetical protein XELAEV_18041915mg [Xenopus laevis]
MAERELRFWILFVTTLDIHLKRVRKVVRKYWPILMTDPSTSKNVIYYLKCPCGKGYVGKNNRMLRLCINEHCSSIRNTQTKATSISQHWAECKHNVAQLRWQVLEVIKTNYVNVDKKLLQIASGSGS